jgi:hypothetical protein
MNRRDRELLDKQFRWLTPKPRNNVSLILAIVGVFLAGTALGESLFAHEGKSVSSTPKVSLVSDLSVR